jgi:histone arginine demethylase JMJD6
LSCFQGATKNWSAPNVFNLEFFKGLYTEEALKITMERCQFFGYKTELTTLKELFEMSAERANLEPGEKPWYIGW